MSEPCCCGGKFQHYRASHDFGCIFRLYQCLRCGFRACGKE